MEDHTRNTNRFTNDELGKGVHRGKDLGVVIQKGLDLPIGITPAFDKVDVFGDQTDQLPEQQDRTAANRQIQKIL